MKLIALLSLCLAAAPGFAADAKVDASTAYQQAVSAYVEAAGKELMALKAQAEAALQGADEAKKAAYAPFLERLKKYEAAFDELKDAAPKDFDRRKALYEARRKEALEALGQVKAP
jgi:hypothetical protein